MSGNLGRSTDPLTHYGREIVLEERTSDPASTSEGDAWLRVDVAPETNQLGTLRFDHGTGTWDIPIYSTGTSGVDVEEVLRIPIGGTVGYVPVSERGKFSELGFQHAGARHSLHNNFEILIPESVVDNFEDEPDGIYASGETVTDYYGGDTGAFTRQTTTVTEGSTALEVTGTTGGAVISSTTGLNSYPSQGDTFRCWVRSSVDDGSSGILYATQSEAGNSAISGYLAQVNYKNSDVRLYRADSGTFTELNSAIYDATADTWYQIEVEWTATDDHTCRLLDGSGTQLTSISATDANYTSGGVGLRHSKDVTGNSSFFDGYRTL